jgi:hypothetical protein
MSEACRRIHERAHTSRRFSFPPDAAPVPSDGIYLVFEEGQRAHGGERIVMVGTHRGVGQLPGRLAEHYVNENKDRSIFRKNIGRALLARHQDPFLEHWDLDLTSRANRDRFEALVDMDRQAAVERSVSDYIRAAFSFVTIGEPDPEERLALKNALIGTVFACRDCGPSNEWLGRHSPKAKIRDSGLWQEQGIGTRPLSSGDVDALPFW